MLTDSHGQLSRCKQPIQEEQCISVGALVPTLKSRDGTTPFERLTSERRKPGRPFQRKLFRLRSKVRRLVVAAVVVPSILSTVDLLLQNVSMLVL